MIETEINTNAIYNMLKNEQKSGELLPIKKDFYSKIAEKLTGASEDQGEQKNLLKVINALKERRKQKILVYLAYDKDLPSPIPSEEEDLYMQIKNILNKNDTAQKPTKVKITKTIPQVITQTGSKLGPYEQNEIVYIYDNTDTKFIIENKLGEIVL